MAVGCDAKDDSDASLCLVTARADDPALPNWSWPSSQRREAMSRSLVLWEGHMSLFMELDVPMASMALQQASRARVNTMGPRGCICDDKYQN